MVQPTDTGFLYAKFLRSGAAVVCRQCGTRMVYNGFGYSCLSCSYAIKIIKPPLLPPSPGGERNPN